MNFMQVIKTNLSQFIILYSNYTNYGVYKWILI
jgi:hypothetical protein